jgi:hypothetical protein
MLVPSHIGGMTIIVTRKMREAGSDLLDELSGYDPHYVAEAVGDFQ